MGDGMARKFEQQTVATETPPKDTKTNRPGLSIASPTKSRQG